MAKEFQTAIILGGGIAGQCCDISVGPLVDDVIDVLLPNSSLTSPATLQINAAINLISTGALGGPKELLLSGVEQPGRFFAFSVENTDLAINSLTITAGISINGGGPSLVVTEPTDYIFFHCFSGEWKAWVQSTTGIGGGGGTGPTGPTGPSGPTGAGGDLDNVLTSVLTCLVIIDNRGDIISSGC